MKKIGANGFKYKSFYQLFIATNRCFYIPYLVTYDLFLASSLRRPASRDIRPPWMAEVSVLHGAFTDPVVLTIKKGLRRGLYQYLKMI